MTVRSHALRFAIGCTTLLPFCMAAPAQTHRVARADAVTRAVGVYEYIGDPQHPKAARLIPVSLFLGGHFEDAGVYLARPVPLALDPGNIYELQQSGVQAGFLDLAYARNFNSGTQGLVASSFDDGWFGYGHIRPLPAPAATKQGKADLTPAYAVSDDGSKPKQTGKTDGAKPLPRGADDDPDRPAKISLPDDTSGRRPDDPDPERPTLHRQTSASGDAENAARDKNGKPVKPPKVVVTASGDPADDPDRPRIRRHTEDENAVPPDPSELGSRPAGKTSDGDMVTAGADITAGPRPTLRRGSANAAVGPELAKVSRNDLSQMVAISDAVNRPAHDFRFHFASDTDRQAVLHQMELLALEVLAHPDVATDAPDFIKAAASAAAPATAAPSQRTRSARAAATKGRTAKAAAPASPSLADEQLSAFQLTFSAEPTYIFTAHTPAAQDQLIRYATVVAQPDLDGKLQIAMRSTTDSAHLDRVPRFRFIDAVDADASNRASLLFELGGAHTRQFALYRLLGARPDQVFVSGTVM